jgi:carboxylesterase type B
MHGSWNDTLVARTYGPSCFQNLSSSVYEALQNKNVSEDCLYLNIHVPFDVSSNNNKAVMVWIHGGGYSTGQAAIYDGAYLVHRQIPQISL